MTVRAFLHVIAACLLLPAAAGAQAVHTAHDHIPDFAARPTLASAAAGSWSDPKTWRPARLPQPADVVQIRHAVSYDTLAGSAAVIAIGGGGRLTFSRTQPTTLRVGTLVVHKNGTLDLGTPSSPIPAGVQAEIVIRNQPLDAVADRDQYGTGLIVGNGAFSAHGQAKSPTWVRLAAEPKEGDTSLQLSEPVSGWAVGDLVVVPDSREDPDRKNDAQLERRRIVAISADRQTISLAPLKHLHPGARDLSGALVRLPHVMNLTRNVLVRSENPAGTRGHTMYTARAAVDIRYAEFRDLGRTTISPLHDQTNHIGRYAMHMHHLVGPAAAPANGHQFTLIGNAVLDTSEKASGVKWPIAIHDSHYGLVQGNTVYNAGGAGIVTEDGSESYNVIEKNMVVRVLGEGDRRGVKANGVLEAGSQGSAFWFRGPNNYVRGNVAANSIETSPEAGYGFEYFQEYLGNIRVPKTRGADTAQDGQYTLRSGYELALLEFADNEAYGQPQGLTYWWMGIDYDKPKATAENVFRDLTLWHISRYPIYGYPGHKVVFDGLTVYGDVRVRNECCNIIWYGDYQNVDAVIRRSTIVGIESVVFPYYGGGTSRIEDSFIAAEHGIVNIISGAPGTCPGCRLPDRTQVIDNVTFAALPDKPLRTITMSMTKHNGSADLQSADRVFVTSYLGKKGHDFRVYYKEQATQTLAGGRAPCTDTATRPEIEGITCPGESAPPRAAGSFAQSR